MARKKNRKRKQSPASATSTKAFTGVEDTFFTAPGLPTSQSSTLEGGGTKDTIDRELAAARSEPSASDHRPRPKEPVEEVAYDASLFDYSAASDADASEAGHSEPTVDSSSLPQEWTEATGPDAGLGSLGDLSDADGYGGGFREDIVASYEGYEGSEWSSETPIESSDSGGSAPQGPPDASLATDVFTGGAPAKEWVDPGSMESHTPAPLSPAPLSPAVGRVDDGDTDPFQPPPEAGAVVIDTSLQEPLEDPSTLDLKTPVEQMSSDGSDERADSDYMAEIVSAQTSGSELETPSETEQHMADAGVSMSEATVDAEKSEQPSHRSDGRTTAATADVPVPGLRGSTLASGEADLTPVSTSSDEHADASVVTAPEPLGSGGADESGATSEEHAANTEKTQPDAVLVNLDESSEVADASGLEQGDPGDLPEPPVEESALDLPTADVPAGLGWDIPTSDDTLSEPGIEPSGDHEALEAVEDSSETPEPTMLPVWDVPRYEVASAPADVPVPEAIPEEIPAEEIVTELPTIDAPAEETIDLSERFRLDPRPEHPAPELLLSLDAQIEEALEVLHAEGEAAEDSVRAAYCLEAGRLYLGKGQSDKARDALKESLAAVDGFSPALRMSSRLDRTEGRWTELVESLELIAIAAAAPRERASALVTCAEIQLGGLKTPETAINNLQEALEAAPGNLYILEMLATIHRQLERWEDLIDVYQAMQARLPESAAPVLCERIGTVYRDQLGNLEAALEWFGRALDLDPDASRPAMMVEELLEREGKLDAISLRSREAAERREGWASLHAWLQVADLAARQEQADSARMALEKARQLEAANAYLRREYLGALARLGDWEGFAEALDEDLDSANGPQSKALIALALARVQEASLDDPTQALCAIDRALEACPDWRLARAEQGRLMKDLGQIGPLVEGLETLAAAQLESHPRQAAGRYFQAGLLYQRGLKKPEQARVCFEKAAKANPDEVIYGWTLRQILEDLELWVDLEELVEDGTLRWPFSGDGGIEGQEFEQQAVIAEYVQQDNARALELYRKAFDTGARSPIALGGYLRMLRQLDDWMGVVEVYQSLEPGLSLPGAVNLVQWARAYLLSEHLDTQEEAGTLLTQMVGTETFLPALWLWAEMALRDGDLARYQDSVAHETASCGPPDDPSLEALGAAIIESRCGRNDPLAKLVDESGGDVALNLLELAYHESSDYPGLVHIYTRRLERPVDIRQATYLQLRRASWLERTGELEGALVDVANAVAEGVHDPITLNRIERLSGALGQSEQLQDLFRRMAEAAEQQTVDLALRMARNLEQRLDSPASALAEYRRASWLDAHCYEALDGIIRLASQQGDVKALAEARTELAKRLPHPEDQADQWLLVGRAYLEAGSTEKAEKALQQCLALGLLQEQAFDLLVDMAFERGSIETLERLFLNVVSSQDSAVLRQCWTMELADQLEAVGAIDQAMIHFEQLAQADGYLPACLRLERLHLASENWEGYVAVLEGRSEVVHLSAIQSTVMERALRIRAEFLGDPWAQEKELLARLEASPGDAEAISDYRKLLASQERWVDLVKFLTERAELVEDATARIRIMLDAAWACANRLDDLDMATDRYQDILKISEGEEEAILALKEICHRREDWNGLVATLACQSLTLAPSERLEAYREIAGLWDEKLDEPETAVDSYRKIVEIDPGDVGALTALIDLFRRLGQWQLFVETAERLLIVREDEDPALLNDIGLTLARRLDEPSRATPFLLRAMAQGQGDRDALKGVVERFERDEAWREAHELHLRLAEASQSDEEFTTSMESAARIAQEKLDDTGLAIAAREQLIARIPGNMDGLWSLAQLYSASKRGEDALKKLDELGSQPDAATFLDGMDNNERAQFHRLYGRLLLEADLKEQAAAHFDAALGLEPGDLELLNSVAELYQAMERWDKYAATLQMQIDADLEASEDVRKERYEALGKAHELSGNLEAALEAFNRLKQLAPTDIHVYLLMAEIYQAMEAWNPLLSLYNNVIKHSTDVEQVVNAYLCKANVLDERLSPTDPSYVPKAVRHYEKALQYDRRNSYAMLRLAEITLRGRNYAKASEWLRRVLAVEPPRERLSQMHMLGGILCAEGQGDPTTAMANFRKAAVASDLVEEQLEVLASAVEGSPGNLEKLLILYRTIAVAQSKATQDS